MKIKHFLLLIIVAFQSCKSDKKVGVESTEKAFFEEQEIMGAPVWHFLNSNTYQLNSLNELDFTHKIDSLKGIYTRHLKRYKGKLDKNTFNDETLGINSAFDKYILEYPQKHEDFTGEKIVISKNNQSRLNKIVQKFNDASLLSNKDFRAFIESYISIESSKKIESHIYDKMDNQQLIADWNTIEEFFENREVNDFWKQEFLYYHIDNIGIKNIDDLYTDFMASCKTTEYTTKIHDIYNLQKKGRESHNIEIYKKVNGFDLEMHLFVPDTVSFKGNRPTIVQFHGGSWSIGKPDWFFETAEEYAKQGWAVAVVNYRIKARQGTYPFEAVKDAKSAIRWLRENAARLKIDSNKIVATGNSAGGHLAIATTLVENWDETTDDLTISAVPNVIMVNSAVYDLTVNNAKWIAENIDNKDLVKEISPNNLTAKSTTKMLLIHGEKDTNCTYSSAENFYNEMKLLGNDIELHTIKDAYHLIWYGRHSQEVSKITRKYIEKLNF